MEQQKFLAGQTGLSLHKTSQAKAKKHLSFPPLASILSSYRICSFPLTSPSDGYISSVNAMVQMIASHEVRVYTILADVNGESALLSMWWIVAKQSTRLSAPTDLLSATWKGRTEKQTSATCSLLCVHYTYSFQVEMQNQPVHFLLSGYICCTFYIHIQVSTSLYFCLYEQWTLLFGLLQSESQWCSLLPKEYGF